MTSQPRWFVVQTHPRAEAKASAHLVRQGFEVYLPRYLKRRRHARRTDTVPAPLFPCYLFVALDIDTQRWRAVLSTVGVRSLVCQGDAPAPLPADTVELLRSQHDERGYFLLDTKPRFARGDRVKVLDGAFSACFGSFEGTKDNERVAILLDLLGRKVKVLMDGESVVAA